MGKFICIKINRKKILLTLLSILVVAIVVITCVIMFGCKQSNYSLMQRNLSEYRKVLYVADTPNFYATFTTGKRENPYLLNGTSEKKVEYGVLTVKFNKEIYTQPTYTLLIDTIQYSGKLEKNPFDNTYVADIGREVSDAADINLKVVVEEINDNINMDNASVGWKINYKKALNIATEEFKDILPNYIVNNVLNAETYVKIVGSTDEELSNIYWYVSIICQNGDSFACIIDPNNGEILARKDNLIA